MRLTIVLLRAALTALLGLCLWSAATAKAATVEHLMIPSAAMGRDIPVAFRPAVRTPWFSWTHSTPLPTSATG